MCLQRSSHSPLVWINRKMWIKRWLCEGSFYIKTWNKCDELQLLSQSHRGVRWRMIGSLLSLDQSSIFDGLQHITETSRPASAAVTPSLRVSQLKQHWKFRDYCSTPPFSLWGIILHQFFFVWLSGSFPVPRTTCLSVHMGLKDSGNPRGAVGRSWPRRTSSRDSRELDCRSHREGLMSHIHENKTPDKCDGWGSVWQMSTGVCASIRF